MKNLRMLILGLLFVLYGSHHSQPVTPLSLSFEENVGQAPSEARYLARGHGYDVVFTSEGNHVLLRQGDRGLSVHTRLVHANPEAAIRGEEKLPGKVNYFRSDKAL